MGAKSQKAGAAWEDSVLIECKREFSRLRARVERRKPGLRVLSSSRGVLRCVADGEPTVDFGGVLAGGRAIFFDTKTTSNPDRFAFNLVEDKQLEFLAANAAMGSLTFLYVLQARAEGHRRRRWLLPVDDRARIAAMAHKRSHELLVNETRESLRWDGLPNVLEVLPGQTFVDALLRLAPWWAKEAA